jgi:Arc/MetJ family transcription regulator
MTNKPPNAPALSALRSSWPSSTLMGKHLVDLDDDVLSAARAELGTTTIKDTVNEALRRATAERTVRINNALNILADAHLDDSEEAWR